MGFPRNLAGLASLLTVLIAVLLICDLKGVLHDGNQFSVASSALNKFSLRNERCTEVSSSELSCNCSNSATPVCPPPSPVRVKEKRVVVQEIDYQPWYAKGRVWHYPVKFPRCSMDACFNYSRCDNTDGDLLIYVYDIPAAPDIYFSRFHLTKWHTANPEQACLFFVFLDTRDPNPPQPPELPYWNGGMNHVLVSFRDVWRQTKVSDEGSIGFASLMFTDIHETTYRPGFDISITLRPKYRMTQFQHLKPLERKYLLTFRGVRYMERENLGPDVGTLRSEDAFREMHNGIDVIVAVTCKTASGPHCVEDKRIYDNFTYTDLMNSTFGLAPAGRSPNSFRFTEILSAGAIPVLIADNYVKPFDTLIQWHKCILQFPTTEMRRIVPTLRYMSKEEMEMRQEYCLKVYNEYFRNDEALLKAAIDSLKTRFLGTFPGLTPLETL